MPTVMPLPVLCRLWFQYVEPLTALGGAYLTYFRPATYLEMTHAPSFAATGRAAAARTPPLTEVTTFALKQLSAAFVFLGLAEGLVLNSTSELRVYRAVVFAMLACDLVYMSSLRGLGGSEWYWVQPWVWDKAGWGNFGLTWLGILLRVLFFYDVGF
ncbi:hypothetical protein GX51_01398 [Blastomyces parvus]|uniref:DUF7704 domain-containing protein n=1 Tax=Blastomyces parvus TaxID=2060905 RepID=A0A2B7XH58_9EURO|nr:hypothetical protein GX51_01398 [Blastomyces parvus]